MFLCQYDVDVGLVMNFSSDYNWRLNAFNFLAADLAVRLGKCKYREDDMPLGFSRSGLTQGVSFLAGNGSQDVLVQIQAFLSHLSLHVNKAK